MPQEKYRQMLSDTAVRNAKSNVKSYKMPDGNGLYLFLQPSGGKLWRYDYRFEGKRKTLSIGKYPIVSLADARAKLEQAKKMIAEGIDPSLHKKRNKIQKESDAQLTFERVAKDWLSVKSKVLSPTTLEKIAKSFEANVYDRIGRLAIKDVIYKDIRDCLLIMQKRGSLEYMHKTRGWIKNVFDFAVNDELLDRSPITSNDDRLQKHEGKNYPHFKCMTDAGKFLRNLKEYPGNIEVQLCAYLIIHVAQRPSGLPRFQ
jgi:hypothetical protein